MRLTLSIWPLHITSQVMIALFTLITQNMAFFVGVQSGDINTVQVASSHMSDDRAAEGKQVFFLIVFLDPQWQ